MLGIEMMLKSLGLDPEQLKKQVAEIGQAVLVFQRRMDSIHSDLQLIKQHLGIEQKGVENGRDGQSEFPPTALGNGTVRIPEISYIAGTDTGIGASGERNRSEG